MIGGFKPPSFHHHPGERNMYKLWPPTGLFVVAFWLLFHGHNTHNKGEQFLADHPVANTRWVLPLDRGSAEREMITGRYMEIGGAALAALGAALFGLGLLHKRVQAQAPRSGLPAAQHPPHKERS
jgi:hypothetical protein